jgi:predicted TIM-barrel fold metal-dependent hydrolase
MQLIDVDAHVTEPPDLWTNRVPEKWKERVPKVGTDANGLQSWSVDGQMITTVGATSVAGWPHPFPEYPPGYDDLHPGSYDAKARLAYLDEQGIAAQVLYPNVGGFGNQFFLRVDDPELKLACVRAYNDFLTEWCSADPDRLLPVAATPFWDVDAKVDEIERCAAMGHRGILFTGAPQDLGEPLLGAEQWDPLWSVATELDLPVSFHIGGGDMFKGFTLDRIKTHGMPATVAWQGVKMFMENGIQLADLLLSGVLPRFPDLKLVSVESGIGWVPFVLEAVDYMFDQAMVSKERDVFDDRPSGYFARQVYSTVWFEDTGPSRLLDAIGPDNVMFETDFPHPACLYGGIQEKAAALVEDQPEAVARKVLHDNGARLYRVAAA